MTAFVITITFGEDLFVALSSWCWLTLLIKQRTMTSVAVMPGVCAMTKDHLTSMYTGKLKVLACHSKER